MALQIVPPEDLPSSGQVPESDLPVDYGSGAEMAKTAAEQFVSGATLGASKKFETATGLTTPEAIAGRESANPLTSFVAGTGGAGALIGLTGGLGGLAEAGTGVLGKAAVGATIGAGFGGVNQATDDWSQNKPLDAQKIAASAGLGALLGGTISGAFEGVKARFSPLAKVALEAINNAETTAERAPLLANTSAAPIVEAPPVAKAGVVPTTYEDVAERVKQAKLNNNAVELPSKGILSDALSRVPLENPVNPLQLDSLSSQAARDLYQSAKESPKDFGQVLSGYESVQKNELVNKTLQAIKDVSPGSEPIEDPIRGGQAAINAFTEQYQNEKSALKPVFDKLRELPLQGEILPDAVSRMTTAVPNIANMFDYDGAELTVKPYKTLMGIDKATYTAAKDAVASLHEAPNSVDALWKIRQGLDQNIDPLAQGTAPSEIRGLKASLMQQIQDNSPTEDAREAFKRYAINEQQRQVIERTFGASVGSPEFGAISKVKPEMIGDKMFSNSATVEAAKNILPPEQFNSLLANWLAEAKAAATDKGAFSSNKFGSFLRRNQSALSVAFEDNPAQLQRLTDLTNIARILPDAPSINPSGTAKTLLHMAKDFDMHGLTWEGMLARIPKAALNAVMDHSQMTELNKALAGQAATNSATQFMQNTVSRYGSKMDRGVKSLFMGTTSQTRKAE